MATRFTTITIKALTRSLTSRIPRSTVVLVVRAPAAIHHRYTAEAARTLENRVAQK